MEKLTIKQHKRMTDELDKVKFTCKYCGRRVVITSKQSKNTLRVRLPNVKVTLQLMVKPY